MKYKYYKTTGTINGEHVLYRVNNSEIEFLSHGTGWFKSMVRLTQLTEISTFTELNEDDVMLELL